MHGLRVWKLPDLESLNAIEESPGRIVVVWPLVHERSRLSRRVPFLAACHAGVTADANIEVNDQRELCHVELVSGERER